MKDFLTNFDPSRAIEAAVVFAVTMLFARLVRAAVRRLLISRGNPSGATLAGRMISMLGLFLATTAALDHYGLELRVLLGAAGVLSVAAGFASQTSASNLISGWFLMFERPFTIGDTIRIGDTTGEVLSIDALSVKLRTLDNLYVRIPNETVIKAEVTNITWFPIRRYDLIVGIAYDADVDAARQALLAATERIPFCLANPEPFTMVTGFGDSAINIQLSAWAHKDRFRDLRNALHAAIIEEFRERGIEIPFPQRTLSANTPIPVAVIQERFEVTQAADAATETTSKD